jgi:hypothetical protein
VQAGEQLRRHRGFRRSGRRAADRKDEEDRQGDAHGPTIADPGIHPFLLAFLARNRMPWRAASPGAPHKPLNSRARVRGVTVRRSANI